MESHVFEADAIEVDGLMSKRQVNNLHEGEIEDCDFLWQGDYTGLHASLAFETMTNRNFTIFVDLFR